MPEHFVSAEDGHSGDEANRTTYKCARHSHLEHGEPGSRRISSQTDDEADKRTSQSSNDHSDENAPCEDRHGIELRSHRNHGVSMRSGSLRTTSTPGCFGGAFRFARSCSTGGPLQLMSDYLKYCQPPPAATRSSESNPTEAFIASGHTRV
jgi:hypothetical protein